MKYLNKLDGINLETRSAITLGKFDGVHIGHQKLIRKIVKKKKEGFQSVLFTFDKLVGAFLHESDTSMLLTKSESENEFNKYDIDYVIECEFTEEFAHMSAEAFIEDILIKVLKVGYIAVGTDCTFGYMAKGDYKLLQQYAKKFDFIVEVVEKVTYHDSEISSTRIRKCIKDGDMENAAFMLGFPYPIIGKVVHGKKLGRTLGFPTINMIPDKGKLLPPNGVYAARAFVDGEYYQGITNIGCKPTVSTEKIRGVETYIFDFDRDLYGKMLEVDLLYYVRKEQKFNSVEELKRRMKQDITIVKKYFIDKSL